MRGAALIASLMCLALPALAAAAINNDACLRQSGSDGIEACSALVAAIGNDLPRLNAHGRVLEELGRHESALLMYRAARGYQPDNRRTLQGLIRARANARATRIVLDIAPESGDVSRCWTTRWMEALDACRAETARAPDDARLQERLGDVARSVGDVATAEHAYARSLTLNPDNHNLRRKRSALTTLLAGHGSAPAERPARPAPVEAPPPPPPAATVRTDAREAAERSEGDETIRKLELLEALRAKALIDHQEYAERRAAILSAAFVTADMQASAAPAAASRYRGLRDGRYLALVVGNDRYANFPELITAGADAEAVSALLRTRYGFEVTTLLDADRYRIMSALSALRQSAGPEDSILLYYAGHGLLDESANRGYWLPVDAERDNLAEWISTNDIAGIFAGAAARHALVIADSCFAGTLLRAADATGLETLQRLASKRSRTVLTSGGLEPVADDGDGTHSVFAAALLETLGANDTVLEASRLFATVRDRVVLNADQTPQYSPMQSAGHEGGDFLFIPKTVLGDGGTH